MKHLPLTILLFAFGLNAHSMGANPERPDTSSFYNMSLEQLMNVEVSVASLKSLTPRESPGIITVITEDEIKNSGAHDLIEVLRQVPGIYFGVDVEGAVGIGIRGNWGHEGKVLLLMDGIEMNERLYSTLQFGEHYPVDQIQKIEIIRGPGSSIYGGNAEYAVINIITKVNKDFSGFSATTSYGQMSKTFSSRSVSINAGKKMGDLNVNFGIYGGQSNRSDRQYTDHFGSSFDMTNNSLLENGYTNLLIDFKNLQFRFLGDWYGIQTKDYYTEILSDGAPVEQFSSSVFDLKYRWNFSRKLSLTPRINYTTNRPWAYPLHEKPIEGVTYFDILSKKPTASLSLNYDISPKMNIVSGAEYFIDEAEDKIDGNIFSNGSNKVEYRNTSLFSQWMWMTKLVNLTIGARYNNNDHFESSFVPRFALTRATEDYHLKALYSYAYRAPGIENINDGIDIKPEQTLVKEVEAGFQVKGLGYFTANLFDITIQNPIVYFNTDGYEDKYVNAKSAESGTKGFELDYKLKKRFGYIDINYSFYTVEGKTNTGFYKVNDGDEKVLLAFPAHSVNGSANINLSKKIMMGITGNWYSSRWEYAGRDSEDNKLFTEHDPVLICGLNLMVQQCFVKGLSASLGCFNLFDAKEEYIQPYSSDHAALPGKSREFRIALAYNLEKIGK